MSREGGDLINDAGVSSRTEKERMGIERGVSKTRTQFCSHVPPSTQSTMLFMGASKLRKRAEGAGLYSWVGFTFIFITVM